MKAYKILRRTEGGKLVSCMINGYLQVEYKENEWVEPKIGRLLAFEDDWCAQCFMDVNDIWGGMEVWECEIVKGRPHNILCCNVAYLKDELGVIRFLIARQKMGGLRYPEGTIFCKKIKLVKKVTK